MAFTVYMVFTVQHTEYCH